MIDCNATINFFKEFRRMCKNNEVECKKCPIYKATINNATINFFDEDIEFYCCDDYVCTHTDKAIEIVQKWSDEHPQKTLLDDLKEKYPNCHWHNDVPSICPYDLGYEKEIHCKRGKIAISCKECWNRPLDEVKKNENK